MGLFFFVRLFTFEDQYTMRKSNMAKVTGKMLKEMIRKMLDGDLPEQQPLPFKEPKEEQVQDVIHAKSLSDIPKAWDSEDKMTTFDLEEFDWRTEEEIFKDQVRFKWTQFKETLSQREQAILRSLLGFNVKRYSVEELENLQGALKGKSTK
jgi:hypothetical protein